MNKGIFKKLKNQRLFLINKNNIKNGRMNIRLNNLDKPNHLINSNTNNKIKSKSTNKIKIVNGMNKFPSIKLNINKNKKKFHKNIDNIENATMNNIQLKKVLHIDDTKIRLKTNKSFNLKNFHSTQNSKKFLIAKTRDTSYNLKRSQKCFNNNDKNLMINSNIGITRHLDRKKIKENKSIILPKHNFKLLKDNKIINNTLNKSRDKYKLNINNNFKKLNNLFEFDKKEKEIQKNFKRNYVKTEINDINKKEIDIISDISLSEEELNFSEEDSIDNMEFSLDDEEL